MSESSSLHSQIFGGLSHLSATDSFGTLRRHQTGARLSVAANAKRIYDEVNAFFHCAIARTVFIHSFILSLQTLMIKKVKTYLNNAEVIEEENRLLDIANQCEPGRRDSFGGGLTSSS